MSIITTLRNLTNEIKKVVKYTLKGKKYRIHASICLDHVKFYLKCLFNPWYLNSLHKNAEKILGGKIVKTNDYLHGIRPKDLIPKD